MTPWSLLATWPPCSALENGSEAPDTKGTPTTSAPGATGTWAWRGAAHWILPKATTWEARSLQVTAWKGGLYLIE